MTTLYCRLGIEAQLVSLDNPEIRGVHMLISQPNAPVQLLVTCHSGDCHSGLTLSSDANEPYKVKRPSAVWSTVLYDLVRFTYINPSEDHEADADAALLWSETLAELEQLPQQAEG